MSQTEKEITLACTTCVRKENTNCDTVNKIFYEYKELIQNVIKKTYIRKGFTYNDQDIEDLHITISAKLFESDKKTCCYRIKKYKKGNKTLRGWIKLITTHETLNFFRGKQLNLLKQKDSSIQIVDEMFSVSQQQEFEAFEHKEKVLSIIKEEIDRYPDEGDRLILKLSIYNELSPKKISKFLKKPVYPLYARKSRALTTLKRIIRERLQSERIKNELWCSID